MSKQRRLTIYKFIWGGDTYRFAFMGLIIPMVIHVLLQAFGILSPDARFNWYLIALSGFTFSAVGVGLERVVKRLEEELLAEETTDAATNV